MYVADSQACLVHTFAHMFSATPRMQHDVMIYMLALQSHTLKNGGRCECERTKGRHVIPGATTPSLLPL